MTLAFTSSESRPWRQNSGEVKNVLHQAAEEFGKRCRNGIPIQDIAPEHWEVENGTLEIPLPGSPFRFTSPPDRLDLESGLLSLRMQANSSGLTFLQQFRFLHLFLQHLNAHPEEARQWKRVFLLEINHMQRRALQDTYVHSLITPASVTESQCEGILANRLHLETHQVLEELLRPVSSSDEILKKGARATLYHSRLQEEPVVIKRYEPNPRKWRRLLERSRAKRAWAGAMVLQKAGFTVPEPLGWIQVTRGPESGVSFYISRPLHHTETIRTRLRREWPNLSKTDRVQVRHELRTLFLELYSCGLVHLDCKLSNIRIPEQAPFLSTNLIWTDLEDIRPRRWMFRTFLRNLYQINGSLPRSISRADRIQFVSGFQHLFPISTSSLLHRYVERVTHKRHRRELRRECGA